MRNNFDYEEPISTMNTHQELKKAFDEKFNLTHERYNPDWAKKRESKWVADGGNEEVWNWILSEIITPLEKEKEEQMKIEG